MSDPTEPEVMSGFDGEEQEGPRIEFYGGRGMSAIVVAKKDYKDAIRSWEMWGLILIFTGLTAGLFYAINETPFLTFIWPEYLEFFGGANLGISTVEFIGFYVGLAEAFLPVVALLITHKAVAGEVAA
jgi:ABC-2 type transport system permease protein